MFTDAVEAKNAIFQLIQRWLATGQNGASPAFGAIFRDFEVSNSGP
jgi:hypothetical protein